MRSRTSEGVLLRARGLTKNYVVSETFIRRVMGKAPPVVHAVDNANFEIRRGEVFGLIGESGCGKTTLGRLLLRLVSPTRGTVEFEGLDITGMPERELRPLRRRMQPVFQDPHASLNPAMTVGDAVAHPLVVHGLADWKSARASAGELFEEVGLTPAGRFLGKRPGELSGGQKQRVVIARAIATRPRLIVADEPVSMLDMSVRAQVLELLLDLKKRHDLTLVFITHDIATARFLCDRLAIMYLGQIVEIGRAKQILDFPEHPYTQALVRAVPQPDPQARRTEPVPGGEVPDATSPPMGCRFHPRCPVATSVCGFSGADFVGLMEERGNANWQTDGTDAVLPRAQRGEEERLKEGVVPTGTALSEAIVEIRREGPTIRVRFPQADPISLRFRPDGRETRCVLYEEV